MPDYVTHRELVRVEENINTGLARIETRMNERFDRVDNTQRDHGERLATLEANLAAHVSSALRQSGIDRRRSNRSTLKNTGWGALGASALLAIIEIAKAAKEYFARVIQ